MNAVVNRYPSSSSRGVIVLNHNSHIRDRPTRDSCMVPNVKMAVQLCQSTRSGPLGPNRASLLMNPMYSIARTRQCPRKSCSPRQPMAAYMWNGFSLSLLSHLYLPLTHVPHHEGNCTASLPIFGTGRQGIAVHFPNVKMAIQLCQSTHTWDLMGRIGHPF